MRHKQPLNSPLFTQLSSVSENQNMASYPGAVILRGRGMRSANLVGSARRLSTADLNEVDLDA